MDCENDVPHLFLCPISLHLMRDPVTVSTGITYDRESIEKWLCSCNNYTCPVTKQPLPHTDLTPNHTLHRLIQSWCTRLGFQNVPTPKPAIDKTDQILKLISEAKRFPENQLRCLESLQSIAIESESNKIYMMSLSIVEVLIDFLASTMLSCNISQEEEEDSPLKSEAAIEVLFHLNPSGAQLKNLVNNETIQLIGALFHVLKHGNNKSQTFAALLLKSAFEVAGPTQMSSVRTELFVEITRVVKDHQISVQGSKAALKLLVKLCSWGRNRVKAVEGGSVSVLIELLFEVTERRLCELMLVALDRLCDCAEGRAELLNHGAGFAIVCKKILWVSHVASDRGVRILNSICRYSASPKVLQEMLQFGVVSKLCLVVQVESSYKAKERAMETLKLHSGVWKNSPCIPITLLSFYP